MKNKVAFKMSFVCVLVFALNMATLTYSLSRLEYFNTIMALACCIASICIFLLSSAYNTDYNHRIKSDLKYFKYRASIFSKPGFEKLSINNCQNAYKLGRK